MNNAKWTDFAAHTNLHYRYHNFDRFNSLPNNKSNMNILWVQIKTAILAANRSCIPQIWISPQQHHKHPFEQPDPLIRARKVASFLLKFKNTFIQQQIWPNVTDWQAIKSAVDKLVLEAKLPTVTLPLSLDASNVRNAKKQLKDIHKSLSALAQNDVQRIKEKAIKSFIDKRCDNLQNDPSKMIDSILNRKKRSIVLDRLLIKDQNTSTNRFTIDPDDIKSATINHFQNFALPSSSAPLMSSRWIDQFNPRDYVDESHYSNLMQSPTYDE